MFLDLSNDCFLSEYDDLETLDGLERALKLGKKLLIIAAFITEKMIFFNKKKKLKSGWQNGVTISHLKSNYITIENFPSNNSLIHWIYLLI